MVLELAHDLSSSVSGVHTPIIIKKSTQYHDNTIMMDMKMNSNHITDIKVTRFRPQALPPSAQLFYDPSSTQGSLPCNIEMLGMGLKHKRRKLVLQRGAL